MHFHNENGPRDKRTPCMCGLHQTALQDCVPSEPQRAQFVCEKPSEMREVMRAGEMERWAVLCAIRWRSCTLTLSFLLSVGGKGKDWRMTGHSKSELVECGVEVWLVCPARPNPSHCNARDDSGNTHFVFGGAETKLCNRMYC